uniref:Myb/SANT-like DNA-binding domain-containing protein n=1 Tax=Manihot esculenta TaxID=3983 RepID=A0A2C9VAI4_MANES
MASCDDDFSLLGDDNHHSTNPNHHHHHHHHILHQPYEPHPFTVKSAPIHVPPQSILPSPVAGSGTGAKSLGGGVEEAEEQVVVEEDNETDSAFHEVNPFSDNSNPFNNERNLRANKRREGEDHSDGANSNHYIYKRPRPSGSAGNSSGEYRKDREEWSDTAIECLLDAYTEKFTQLNRGNLRGRDWEEVAATVSERCQKQAKTVEQCKNKVDNLKKRYKLERHRMSNGGISVSHWPWFKKMEEIVGNSLPMKVTTDENKSGGSSGTAARQSKSVGFYSISIKQLVILVIGGVTGDEIGQLGNCFSN